MTAGIRTGLGYDVHRLAEGETLVLGGVNIPSDVGTVAHSDGDVLLHAICDAMLGALALGDIGRHFPDTDPAYSGISSLTLLDRCNQLIEERGFRVGNLDATIVLESPKLINYNVEMRESIAAAIGIPVDEVSIKATTSEKLGFVGTGDGISAMATVMLLSRDSER